MNTDAEANKLDAALSTFSTLINNECQDKLTIKYYFKEKNLQKYTPILLKNKFRVLENLNCENDEEFEKDILPLLEEGVKKEEEEADGGDNKKEEEEEEKEGIELAKQLISDWGLSKYFKVLCEDEGWEDPEDWDDLTVDELMSDPLKFRKPHAKKFVRKYKEWKNKGSIIGVGELRLLKEICQKPDSW
eukprot:284912_1